jgi:hypothetical protein
MNPPTLKTYKSYTSPKPPKSKRKATRKSSRKSSNSNRRSDAAQKIQRTFRKRRLDERPPTTRPSVQQMINNIFSMKNLNELRLKQARRATCPRSSSRAQYHLGATGSW